jgi:branched-chain amino acid transport system substrate-binding protein
MNVSRRQVLVFGAIAGGSVLFGCRPRTNAQGVHVAVNLPFSGPLAVYGVSIREGVEYYLARTPGANGRLSFDWQDNASDPGAAVRIAGRQLESGSEPDVYVSGVKPQAMAIMPSVTRAGMPHFVWIFDAHLNTGGHNNFRTWVSYKVEPAKYIEFVKQKRASRVSVAYVQLPHTVEEFEKILLPALRRDSINVTTEVFEFGRTDFREIARRLLTGSPEALILNGFQLELSALVRALRQEPGYDPAKIIGTYDMLDAAQVLSPTEMEGLRVVAPRFATSAGQATNAAWIEGFRKKFRKAPLYTNAFAYDMASILDNVARMSPALADHGAWLKALHGTRMSGVTGELSFDADGDLNTPLVIGIFKNGAVQVAPEEAGTV